MRYVSFSQISVIGLLLSLLQIVGCSGGGGPSSASFTQSFVVTTSANVGGTISPSTLAVSPNDTVIFTITPDTGYAASVIEGCDGVLVGDQYITDSVIADCTVRLRFTNTFAQPTFMALPIKKFSFHWSDVPNATEYRLLENPDGRSGFQDVSDSISAGTISYIHAVPLLKRQGAQYILRSCFSLGCNDSMILSIDGPLVEAIGYLKASNPGQNDQFGGAVSISGDGKTLAVGAVSEASSSRGVNGNELDDSLELAGAVYVYERSESAWGKRAYLKASNAGLVDSFGVSLSISEDGNTLVVGANNEDGGGRGVDSDQDDKSAERSGAAYVFTRADGVWNQHAYLKASNTDEGDWFGNSVSISADGNTIAIGAHTEDSSAIGINGNQTDNSQGRAGAAYVFVRDGNFWRQEAYIKASNSESRDNFGRAISVSADGNTLAVSATGEDSAARGVDGDQLNNAAADSGAVYLFARIDGEWSQQAYLKASNTDASDFFGGRIGMSLDGNTLVVTALSEQSMAQGQISDQTDNSSPHSGAAYVFVRSNNEWRQRAFLKSTNAGGLENFGSSVAVALNGDLIAIGAGSESRGNVGINGDEELIENSISSGATYVFERSGKTWVQTSYVKASVPDAIDGFGRALDMDDTGDTLVVGAPKEGNSVFDSELGETDFSNSQSGAVYIY